jgi:hypothetical protein
VYLLDNLGKRHTAVTPTSAWRQVLVFKQITFGRFPILRILAIHTVAAVMGMLRCWQPAQLISSTQVDEEAEAPYLVWAGHAPGEAAGVRARFSASRSVTEAVAGATTATIPVDGAKPATSPAAGDSRPSAGHPALRRSQKAPLSQTTPASGYRPIRIKRTP